MTIDLDNAAFADLVALVDAARVAGIDPSAKLELDDTTLNVTVEPSPRRASTPEQPKERSVAPLGDAAIRSVVDILTGRQEPPRH